LGKSWLAKPSSRTFTYLVKLFQDFNIWLICRLSTYLVKPLLAFNNQLFYHLAISRHDLDEPLSQRTKEKGVHGDCSTQPLQSTPRKADFTAALEALESCWL